MRPGDPDDEEGWMMIKDRVAGGDRVGGVGVGGEGEVNGEFEEMEEAKLSVVLYMR